MNFTNYYKINDTPLNRERLIADETARISWQNGKSFLDCDDLIKLTGLGRDNVAHSCEARRSP